MELTLADSVKIPVGFGLGFLLLATTLTVLLKLFRPQNVTYPKVLKIIGGWWIIGALIVFSLLLGERGLILLFLIASLLALKEYLSLQQLEFVRTPELVGMSLLTIVHYSFLLLGWKNFFLFIVPLFSFIYLPFFFLSRRKIQGLIANLWSAQSGLMLCVYFLSFVPGLIFLNDNETAIRKIDVLSAFLFLFFTTEMNDVFQFLNGKLFGKTKLVAEISPNKTLAGFIGGIICTILLSYFIAPPLLQLTAPQSIILGACISISGISGDLMFSSLKRTYGVKDFSDLIPGHGGVLDRLDSIIFTAPTLYSLMYIFLHLS
jgi:phosphatidate cytidylyltransferase